MSCGHLPCEGLPAWLLEQDVGRSVSVRFISRGLRFPGPEREPKKFKEARSEQIKGTAAGSERVGTAGAGGWEASSLPRVFPGHEGLWARLA